jgi:hypothetical protein
MTKDEALDLALEALEQYTNVVTSVNDPNSWETVVDGGKPARDAITAIKQARSAPVQEPAIKQGWDVDTPLNKPAAQRQWVGLTDEDWQDISDKTATIIWSNLKQAIEAKLKEKNT